MSNYLTDPTARLRVWRVTARRADGQPGPWVPTLRIPAHTPEEAVQVAATHSGLDRAVWADYYFTPTHEEIGP